MPDDLRQAEATKMVETASISLQPKNASLIEEYPPGATISVAIRGRVSSLSLSEYGSTLCLEIDSLAVREPEPESFVEEAQALKVLKG